MASVLVIEERTGNSETDRSIGLMGGALPFQGAEWAAEMILVTQFNPGNAEGTQHVIGPQEMPSNWEGYWNTTRLVAAPSLYIDPNNGIFNQPIVRADSLMTILEDMYRGGKLLRVTWAGDAGKKIVRIGRARSWNFKPTLGFDDIKWTTQFDWIGRGQENQNNATQFQGDALLSSVREANVAAGQATEVAYERDLALRKLDENVTPTFQLSELTALVQTPVRILDDLGSQMAGYQQRLLNLGTSLRDFRVAAESTPTALTERATDIGNGIVETGNKFARILTQQPCEVVSSRSRVATLIRCENYLDENYVATLRAIVKGDALARVSRRQLNAFNPQVLSRSDTHRVLSQDMLKVYIPAQTDTMVTISLKFYRTDSHAAALARINGLPGYTITPPRIALMIPTLSALQRQSVGNI